MPEFNGIPLTSPRRLHRELVLRTQRPDIPAGAQQAWLAVLLLADEHGRLPAGRIERAVDALVAAGTIVATSDGPDWFIVEFMPSKQGV